MGRLNWLFCDSRGSKNVKKCFPPLFKINWSKCLEDTEQCNELYRHQNQTVTMDIAGTTLSHEQQVMSVANFIESDTEWNWLTIALGSMLILLLLLILMFM